MPKPNRYHGEAEDKAMDRDDWGKCWQEGKIYFHKQEYNQFLVKHLDKLLGKEENCRVFVPLCGKSLDMKCLYERGYTIVGVEGSSKAIEEFFTENNYKFSVEPVNVLNGKLYKSEDTKLNIYCCDFFDFISDLEESFDCIWDRGSFGAVSHVDRARYAEIIKSIMGQSCRALVSTFSYDEKEFIGPPRCVPRDIYDKLYGNKCKITLLDSLDMLTEDKRLSGVTRFDNEIYLMTPHVKE